MKKVLLLSICILLCAGAVFGQAGGIGLYFDQPAYSVWCFDDVGPLLVPIYAVHKLCPGATASQWMVVAGGGFNCTYTGEIVALPTSIGSTQSGISIAYGGCVAADNLLLATINYFCMGASPVCASLEVVPDPSAPSGTIEIIDCFFIKLVGVGNKAYFNNDGSCWCWDSTKHTSWGRVKTLYR